MKKYFLMIAIVFLILVLTSCPGSLNKPPNSPILQTPNDGSKNQPTDIALNWECSDPNDDNLVYDVYFGTHEYPPQYASDYPLTDISIKNLQENTTYYWKIKAKDTYGNETTGSIWSFTTKKPTPKTLTLSTIPKAGLEIAINGISYKSPKTVIFSKGELVEIKVITPQELDEEATVTGNDTKYIFSKWHDETTNPSRNITMTADATYTAYMNKEYKAEIVIKPDEISTIDEYRWYEADSIHNFSAPAITGFTFDHWEVNGKNWGSQTELTLTIDSPMEIVAVYKLKEFALTINATNGTVIKSPNQTTYEYGTEVKLEAIPEEGYQFDRWEGDISVTTNPTTIVMKSDKSITAVFKEQTNHPPAIDIPDQEIDEGTTLVLDLSNYATDSDGDTLTYTLVDGVGNLEDATYTHSPDYESAGIYYVTIEVSDGRGGTAEDTFEITVKDKNAPPEIPNSPNPTDEATGVSTDVTLSWKCSDIDGDSLKYSVYFGEFNPPTSLKAVISDDSYDPVLDKDTTYYWKIVAKDGNGGETEGPVWSFKTK